jgi:hypothetical protein
MTLDTKEKGIGSMRMSKELIGTYTFWNMYLYTQSGIPHLTSFGNKLCRKDTQTSIWYG